MTTTWQDILARLMVFLAAAYVVRFAWRSLSGRSSPGCGSCGNCPDNAMDRQPSVVAVTLPEPVRSTPESPRS